MKTEQDYRVTYEVAKLMKQADYVGLATACYYIDNGEIKYVEGIIGNSYNSYPNCCQAPLTPMALDWAESLGYVFEAISEDQVVVCYKNEPLLSISNIPVNGLETAFLTAVCNHIITNKTNK